MPPQERERLLLASAKRNLAGKRYCRLFDAALKWLTNCQSNVIQHALHEAFSDVSFFSFIYSNVILRSDRISKDFAVHFRRNF
jgi:hypothetical protein